MSYFHILRLASPPVFIGVIIYGFIKWKKLRTWLKGGLIGITSYWFLFFVLDALVLLNEVHPDSIFVMAIPFIPFYYLFQSFNLSEGHLLAGGIFIGSPLIFGLIGILIGLSVNKFKKRSSIQAKHLNLKTGTKIVR